MSRNNLQVPKFWLLICLFKFSSMTLFLVITAAIISSSVKLQYSDTPGVVLAEEQQYVTKFTPGIIN